MCRRLCMLATAFVVLGFIGTASADLVGHWSFDEGQGEIAKDGSGYGNDGTIYNATWVAGQLGSALEFVGADQAYVDIPPESWDPIEQQATCAVWMYIDSAITQSPFTFSAYQDPPDNNTRVFSTHVVWGNGNIYFDTAYDGSDYDRIEKAPTVEEYADAWMHWAFVKNADTGDQQIFINGELWHSGTGATRAMTGVTKFVLGTKCSFLEGWWTGMMDDFQLYNHALTADEIKAAMLGISQELATSPTPADQAIDVPRDVSLAWEAGEYAVTHDVYLGTVFDDVNDASRDNDMGLLLSQGQTAVTYALDGVYEYGQTYYWRVDEVNGAPDNTIFKGDTWSFTVEPLAYPIANVTATSNVDPLPSAGPENMVNGSGLNENDEHSTESFDMWQVAPTGDDPLTIEYAFDAVYKLHEMLVWNYNVQFELMLGFGLKDVTIEYSENGEDWTVLGDVVLNQATAQPTYAANTTVDFGGVAAQYVKLTVNSGWGTLPTPQYGLSEVRFLQVPVQAREPQPEDGAVNVAADADLSWRAGREGVSHEVYLSTDPDALELIDTTSTTTVDPGALDLAATYYWRVDEVNDAEAISTWAGVTWSFSTEPNIVVEDFESYTDDIDAGGAIFLNWIDGYEINGNGSTVGHMEAPFAEQTVIHGGAQSMPLFFDNTNGVTVSEAERTLDVPMDWTAYGIKSLSVAFAGDAANVAGQLYLKVNGTKVVYGGSADDLKVSGWLAWTIDVSALGNVSNVTTLAIGVEGAGASGVVYIDDIRLYPQEIEMVEPVEPDPAGLMAHYTFDSDFQDSSGSGNHAQVVGDAAITNDPARGGIASLDGLGDAILVPAIGDGTASEVTISLWMNTDIAWTSGYFSLFHCDGWAAGDIHMHVSSPGYFTAGVNGMGDNLQSATMPEVDQWYNVTVVVSASEASLYVNGIQEDSRIPTEVPETFIFGEGHLGIWLNGANLERALTGQIDDVRFYNRTLSYGEAMGLAGRTTSLYKPF